MNPEIKIILKKGKEQSLERFHPWIFSGAIYKIIGNAVDGSKVEVFSAQNEYLATGHYQIGSIAVRILSFKQCNIDQSFWQLKFSNALYAREIIGLTNSKNTNVFRLIHGEGDGLPGLIIDFYNGTAVIQMHSIGMYLDKEDICEALKTVLGNKLKAIYNKSHSTLPFKSSVSSVDGYLWGTPETTNVIENNCKFNVNWETGQKTGFFIDQRENRLLLSSFCKNKAVLNMFGYTGGFSVYALRGGANFVHSVDSSKPAIELTNENIALNFTNANHESFATDAFEFLRTIDNKYDVIILDPPAFAKHNDSLKNALQAYKRINAVAIEKIKPGGIIFTFSCSQVVTKLDFRLAVFSAAAIAKRNVRILHQLTQPADHPVNIYHPEGEYLKGLVLHIE